MDNIQRQPMPKSNLAAGFKNNIVNNMNSQPATNMQPQAQITKQMPTPSQIMQQQRPRIMPRQGSGQPAPQIITNVDPNVVDVDQGNITPAVATSSYIFSIFGFGISKTVLFIILAVVILVLGYYLYKRFFGKSIQHKPIPNANPKQKSDLDSDSDSESESHTPPQLNYQQQMMLQKMMAQKSIPPQPTQPPQQQTQTQPQQVQLAQPQQAQTNNQPQASPIQQQSNNQPMASPVQQQTQQLQQQDQQIPQYQQQVRQNYPPQYQGQINQNQPQQQQQQQQQPSEVYGQQQAVSSR